MCVAFNRKPQPLLCAQDFKTQFLKTKLFFQNFEKSSKHKKYVLCIIYFSSEMVFVGATIYTTNF